jgi:hypothetical protein
MALAAVLVASDDPGGWSKAKWGMTEREILKAFDGQVKRFGKGEPRHRAGVGIDALEVAGVKFNVSMGFGTEDKLETVLFEPADQMMHSLAVELGRVPAQVLADETDDTVQRVKNLLIQKYGRPWEFADPVTGSSDLKWTFPTTEITLSRLDSRIPGRARQVLMSLTYSSRPSRPL